MTRRSETFEQMLLEARRRRGVALMGVCNVTPDSFSDGGKHFTFDGACEHVDTLVMEGADLVDIGAESTRPGAARVGASDQLGRMLEVVRYAASKACVSVDTTSPDVARACLEAGAVAVNDVSCLADDRLAEVVREAHATLVLMHARGSQVDMRGFSVYPDDAYGDVVEDVVAEWLAAADRAAARGLDRRALVMDPGLGFAKNARQSMELLRRTSELVARCEGAGVPAYGAEVGAGFPPFFAPMDPSDSLYTLLAALAYGLRGYNLYMAVERDRWIGAPVDPHGRRRPFADAYETLGRALDATRFHELVRRAPVRLVIPRSLRRLARASHAFGPLTPALFNILGAGFRESCLEDDFGLDLAPTVTGEAYVRAFERALSARGVPFAYAGGESLESSLVGATWIVCVLAGGVKASVLAQLKAATQSGVIVTVGPSIPERDGSMRRLSTPHDVAGLEIEPLLDATRADALVARRIEQLGLPTFRVDPSDAFVTPWWAPRPASARRTMASV